MPGGRTREPTHHTYHGRLRLTAFARASTSSSVPESILARPFGELRLDSLTISAFQGIDLPRRWDDDEREPDDSPDELLAQLFARVKSALYAWGEVMDHLSA